MLRTKDFMTLLLLIAASCHIGSASTTAALTVATVSSEQAFLLDGRLITAPGVSSWPVVVGDDIVTSSSPANLSFQDGSILRLAPQSHIKITGTADQPTVVLFAGNLEYRLVPNSKLKLVNARDHAQDTSGQQPQTPQAPSGASAGKPHNIGRDVMWGALIAGAAAGIGAGVAIATSGGGTTVPPVSAVP